jgi:hypothetical protein
MDGGESRVATPNVPCQTAAPTLARGASQGATVEN